MIFVVATLVAHTPGAWSSDVGKTDDGGSAPSVIEARVAGEGSPLWVSAEAATDSDGTIDWEAVGPEFREALRDFAESPPVSYSLLERFPGMREMSVLAEEQNPDGTTTTWYHYGWSSLDMPLGKEWDSLGELATEAKAIYLGSVTGITQGFFSGSPASLLTIRMDEVLLAKAGHRPGQEVYVYYPAARFSIGELNFWKSGPAFPQRPTVGDRLLVVTDRPPSDTSGLVVIPEAEGVFIEAPQQDGIRTKSTMKSVISESSRLDDLAGKLRTFLGGEGKP